MLLLLLLFALIHCNALVLGPTTPSPSKLQSQSQLQSYTINYCSTDQLLLFQAKSTARELYLEHCYLPELPNAIFIRYTALETLEITDSNLTTLQDHALNGLKNLRVLSLARNNLQYLKSWSYEALLSLVSLDLRRNAISKLTLNSFHRYPNLQRLNLAVNLIDDIDEGIFGWMPNLKYLNLGRNQLKIIEARNFYGMHRLTHLALHHNSIAKIEHTAFESNTHLRSLRLEGNALSDLQFMSVNMVQLVHLNLSHNLIESLDNLTFAKAYEICDLDLSYNVIRELQADTLAGLESMESLNISHNALQHIQPDSFNMLSRLQWLDISVNNLTTLAAQLFSNNKQIQHLNLSTNALQKIEAQTFAKLSKLRVLDLARNHLKTDGFLQNFAYNLERSQLKLNLSHNDFTMLNITTLASFHSVELAGNTWNCKWVIPEIMRPGTDPFRLHFARNAAIITTRWSNNLTRISSIDCFDEDSKRSIILLERAANDDDSVESSVTPTTPPFIWPKISLDKFDSRSMIIWLLIFIFVVFAMLRIYEFIQNQRKRKQILKELAEKEEADARYIADDAEQINFLKNKLSMKYRDSLDDIVKQKTCRLDRLDSSASYS